MNPIALPSGDDVLTKRSWVMVGEDETKYIRPSHTQKLWDVEAWGCIFCALCVLQAEGAEDALLLCDEAHGSRASARVTLHSPWPSRRRHVMACHHTSPHSATQIAKTVETKMKSCLMQTLYINVSYFGRFSLALNDALLRSNLLDPGADPGGVLPPGELEVSEVDSHSFTLTLPPFTIASLRITPWNVLIASDAVEIWWLLVYNRQWSHVCPKLV